MVQFPKPTPFLRGGLCWLDRNLGASKVATAFDDQLAYGDLFQWGCLDDGHQDRQSGATSTLSNQDVPGHDDFITVNSSPYEWPSPQNNALWQGEVGIDNPCPDGWRVPTEDELNAERQAWVQTITLQMPLPVYSEVARWRQPPRFTRFTDISP